MSSPRPIQVGDIVKFRQELVREPDRPWGAFTVEARRSRKYFWLRCWTGQRLKAHWRNLEVLRTVEERVADMLMETER